MSTPDELQQQHHEASQALAQVDPTNLAAHVADLAHARELVDHLLNEAAAQAVLDGASIRAVATEAGLSPNALGPRLASTAPLAAYAEPTGRVTAEGVVRARYDSERGTPPPSPALTFTPRRRTSR